MNEPNRAPDVFTTCAAAAVSSSSLPWPARASAPPGASATLSAACTIARTRCWSAPSDPESFHDPNASTTVAVTSASAESDSSVGRRRGNVNVRTGRPGSLATMIRQRAFALLGLSFCLRIRFRSSVGSLGARAMVLRDGAQIGGDRDRARDVFGIGTSAHPAGSPEDAARLDAHALRGNVALDRPLGEDLEVTFADHVALNGSRDDDVGAAHAAPDDSALAEDDRRARLDRSFDPAVDAKPAVRGQIAAHRGRPPDDVLDDVTLGGGAFLRQLRSPCHANLRLCIEGFLSELKPKSQT